MTTIPSSGARAATLCRLAIVLSLVALAVSPVRADRVVLKTGRELNGSIVSETASEVAIKTEVGVLRFPRAEVRDLVRENTTTDEVAGDRAMTMSDWASSAESYRKAADALQTGSRERSRVEQKLARAETRLRETQAARTEQALAQAKARLASGELEQALKLAEEVKAGAKDDALVSASSRLLADIHLAMADRAADRQDALRADEQLKAAVDADPDYYLPVLMYGEKLVASSVTEAMGIEMLERGLELGKGRLSEEQTTKYNYILGRRYFSREEYDKAADKFANTLGVQGKYPAYSDGLDWAVQSYLKLGEQTGLRDIDKTIRNLNEALRLNPSNKDALFFLGSLYRDSGQTGEAIAALEKLVEQDDKYEKAYLSLARAYQDAEMYEKALEALNNELKNKANDYDSLTDRAEVNIVLANYENARKDLESATRVDPNKWRAFLLRAQLSFAQENFEEAQTNLQRVLQINPDSVEANILMGRVFVAGKEYDTARKWFQAVVDYLQGLRNPSFRFRRLMAEAQTHLGEIDLLQDSPRSAEERLREALEFVPEYARAVNKIGDVKRRLGDEMMDPTAKAALYAEAKATYERAIEMNPRDPDFYLSLGILYHKNLKNPEEALKNYQEYLDRGGRDKTSVNKWIQEVTKGDASPVPVDGMTTGTDGVTTATTGVTTGTEGLTTATPAVAAPATDMTTAPAPLPGSPPADEAMSTATEGT